MSAFGTRQPMPQRRPLKIFGFDPLSGREVGSRVTVDIPYENLEPGPRSVRMEVIDYDATHQRYYPPVDLNDPAILMQGGLAPDQSDPRFHQQMVYAVCMKVLENFETALGRTLTLKRKEKRLRIFPHAFHAANAYYDREQNALLFGYFRADMTNPGPNLPGQMVYTCLSHDIIAHEMTHALVDRLRRYFLEPSNLDVLAFHEGFADIVALFQHFTLREVVREQVQQNRTDLRKRTLLVQLARQFGSARGSGTELRSALAKPEFRLSDAVTECHERGSILVAAVFDAFFNIHQRRIRDLIRIATGGTGNLPDADLHPDLVTRVANDAASTAESVLRVCIRAFDYLPPVDITFGDFLRALVTADYEANPIDDFGVRASLIESFRLRGIYPAGVHNLDEEALVWPLNPQAVPNLDIRPMLEYLSVDLGAFARSDTMRHSLEQRSDEPEGPLGTPEEQDDTPSMNAVVARALNRYAKDNAVGLALDPTLPIGVRGFHSTFRVGRNGRPRVELVAQFAQRQREDIQGLGGIPFRGGTTVVFASNGEVRYVIAKPLATAGSAEQGQQAAERLERQREFARLTALADPHFGWNSSDPTPNHMRLRMNLAALHQ